MRGKGLLTILTYMYFRITPTHAGKSSCSSADNSIEQNHPRVCGEKSMVCPRSDPGTGSPPRMRGKVPDLTKAAGQAGITPAHAGKSRPLGVGRVRSWDHPRVCGEKPYHRRLAFARRGSPPHMRGKVKICSVRMTPTRITPAHAGKSGSPPPPLGKVQDHPRTCGEK